MRFSEASVITEDEQLEEDGDITKDDSIITKDEQQPGENENISGNIEEDDIEMEGTVSGN